ncbi:MAG: murein biosynthesis integral membrane protein MurJ [Candidatus Staskawiczbacteria bacterium RIFOXYB2_FULL_32_9]|uniref:Probable lipid II flippase MurJ n=1 Tax=Candidatus Staskawiczbacteria bacterium RIFOXYD1_FULL_32_13 TaxID=1802234 RepID=A0A1G2JNI4_9BACT|nr:MAG: Integral membrane protein MviN [Parcubacteria group bacterium GW2011_GWC2_32_10]OGZ79032.1 MAG: murein biosynthesis integral membrane protein MurJ [Candidatus Staskawiczbacteria bacterium RIFOXYB1_FULL_32_11]OGZ79715.1 MAG: murein biosynthesis integral membrane protein MurJ [Candidatus Staskawiczbacteria bacterium RIFOXYA2_FULL_32_7]OGZ82988.1 MAG: murein biosynthesis integral membrane protein MurJ [Candidatus Staskawiczbacteria bacterium RIFOXYB2_FULL_32_9]OGZ87818.1 MAG: murein biosyn
MFQKLLNLKTEKVSMAALIISVASFFSFLLGLLRDRLLASTFNASNELDVYFTAFRIPDFVAMVLMMGAISVAVIPIFTDNLNKNRESAFKYLSNLFNLCLIILVVVCSILFIFTPQLISLIAPGFSLDKKQITVELTRIMFLSPILMGLSNMISAVLMVFKRFLITAISPILYNLGSIIGILFFVPTMGIKGLAWGIILGAVMHLAIQVPSFLKTGFKFTNTFNFFDKDFLLTIKLTIPRAIGLTASQINLIIITVIASTLVAGSVSVFSLANDLTMPIIGLIAIPFATAVFPALSLAVSRNDKQDFLDKFYSVFRQILFLIIPVSGLCYILRAHLVRLVFGAGRFDWTSTKLTAACFGIFMISLFAQGLIFLISRAFYANKSTAIPALISVFSVLILTPLAYLFVWLLQFSNAFSYVTQYILRIDSMQNLAVIGLPLAIAIDVIIQFILLLVFLKFKIKEIRYKNLFIFFVKVLGATILAMVVAYIARQIFGGFLGSSRFIILLFQTAIAGGLGFLSYMAVGRFMKFPEIESFRNFILSQVGFLNLKKKI